MLPEICWFRVCWSNNSLAGFWCRLRPCPLENAVFLAVGATVVQSITGARRLLGIGDGGGRHIGLVRALARSRDDEDRAFGLAVTAMLLVTPICWDHYFLLLLLPLAVCWRGIKPLDPVGWVFGLILAAIWLDPAFVWRLTGGEARVAGPGQNLTVLSYQFYALLTLFGVSVAGLRKAGGGPRLKLPVRRQAEAASALQETTFAHRWTSRQSEALRSSTSDCAARLTVKKGEITSVPACGAVNTPGWGVQRPNEDGTPAIRALSSC